MGLGVGKNRFNRLMCSICVGRLNLPGENKQVNRYQTTILVECNRRYNYIFFYFSDWGLDLEDSGKKHVRSGKKHVNTQYLNKAMISIYPITIREVSRQISYPVSE